MFTTDKWEYTDHTWYVGQQYEEAWGAEVSFPVFDGYQTGYNGIDNKGRVARWMNMDLAGKVDPS